MIVNHLLKNGKKALAYRILYTTLQSIETNTGQDAIQILEQAIRNVTPLVEVKARRVGGSTYQVPIEVQPERGTALAIKWLLQSARNRSGRDIQTKLTQEFIDASNHLGNAIRKRDETHRMAEANKAFAHYRL
jgi:small subunit ribosomal protein S7